MKALYCPLCRYNIDPESVEDEEGATQEEATSRIYTQPNGRRLRGPRACPACGNEELLWY